MLLTTGKMSKKLPTTDRKSINRLPTWADIINIFVSEKRACCIFFQPLGSYLIKINDSPDGLTERTSSFVDTGTLLQLISLSQKPHLKDATDFINFIEKTKVKKLNVSCFGPRNA